MIAAWTFLKQEPSEVEIIKLKNFLRDYQKYGWKVKKTLEFHYSL